MRHTIYLGLGTNIGDRAGNLAAALAALTKAVRVIRASAVYETEPWGYTDQPWFLNQAALGETALAPLELLAYLKRIEKNLGRTPTFQYGPRSIDLDILVYDSLQLESPQLVIPHPHLAERPFILAPLADLAPDLVIPGLQSSVQELLRTAGMDGIRKL